jgi:superfamily II DNA or RNA helicase
MSIQFHQWQIEGFKKYMQSVALGKKDFLCAVTGGGGKTIFGLECAKRMIAAQLIDRIIVVTFTSHLVRQWEKRATEWGVRLLAVNGNGALKKGLPDDCSGYVCTYAALGRMPDLHETFATLCRTLVIFDEIHHLGDVDEEGKSRWGERAKLAFVSVAYRLALSGTPFRSNNQRIPFVHYEPREGSNTVSVVIPDHSYCYGLAVADGVCRRVIFKEVDGPVCWTHEKYGDLEYRFGDDIDEKFWGDRLRFAVSPERDDAQQIKSGLLVDLLKRANNRLNDIRRAGHPDAAGLIVASGVDEARKIVEILRQTTGHRAIIVANDEEGSVEKIAAFTKGEKPWIVAVKMVSEGVDIPRLRVCVYAARITEELFVLQVIFRIVRMLENVIGESYFFYPADHRLVAIARTVEAEIEREIIEREKTPRTGIEPPEPAKREFVGATSETWKSTMSGEIYSDEDIEIAEAFRHEYPSLAGSIVELAKFNRSWRKYHEAAQPQPDDVVFEESYNEKRERLRREIHTAVGRLHHLSGRTRPFNEINFQINSAVGVSGKESASIEQLEKMLNLVNEEIAALVNGDDDDDFDDDDRSDDDGEDFVKHRW